MLCSVTSGFSHFVLLEAEARSAESSAIDFTGICKYYQTNYDGVGADFGAELPDYIISIRETCGELYLIVSNCAFCDL